MLIASGFACLALTCSLLALYCNLPVRSDTQPGIPTITATLTHPSHGNNLLLLDSAGFQFQSAILTRLIEHLDQGEKRGTTPYITYRFLFVATGRITLGRDRRCWPCKPNQCVSGAGVSQTEESAHLIHDAWVTAGAAL